MLRPIAGDQTVLEVEGATIAAALDELRDRYPALERRLRDESGALRRYVNFYVDGEECRRLAGADTPLAARTELMIIPSVAGG
ncbi:molybdopterin synthase sulfur carrier subunit [Amycolatopsis albispora]|uniref:Molybdopterin synthase sulfur carrier subunit n=2 Tax=Amycolatopsis albispora TaxID=1804986 RepID=A0A344LL88_9PSEU|nr:molybdopterin synthase sulfur carrier subunit [Amycolatopsis albispora]